MMQSEGEAAMMGADIMPTPDARVFHAPGAVYNPCGTTATAVSEALSVHVKRTKDALKMAMDLATLATKDPMLDGQAHDIVALLQRLRVTLVELPGAT